MIQVNRATLFIFWFMFLGGFAKGQVVANFSVSPASGCSPLSVTFSNHSTGATGYVWNLDNGDPPIYSTGLTSTYTIPGTHTATLTAYNGTDSVRYTQAITVYPRPVVDFRVSDTAVCPWTSLTFTSTAIGEVPGPVINDWYFGDGDTGIGTSERHIYTYPSHFNVTLTAYNADGCSADTTKSGYIHIFTPPQIFITADTYFCHPPATVVFTDSIVGKSPFTYAWSFGDLANSTVRDPTHTYTATGSYTVQLQVTDSNGCKDTLLKPGYIRAGNVYASFTYPDTVCIFTQATFTNTSATFQSFLWRFGNGDTSLATIGKDTFSTAGLDTVSLTITDSQCVESVSHAIYVHPGPVASFTQSPANLCFPPPSNVLFTATAPAGSIVRWLFSDGGIDTGTTVTHNYHERGVDTIRMVVFDPSSGCQDTVTKIDTIYDFNFNYDFRPSSGCIPLNVSFTSIPFTYEPPPDTSLMKAFPYAINYTWNFGDGASTHDPSPAHTYTAFGIFTADVYAVSINGCIATDTMTIYAGTVTAATFTATPTHVCYHDSVLYRATPAAGDSITFYSWDFGDLKPNPETIVDSVDTIFHVDLVPGLFTVTLTPIYNGCPGTPTVKTNYILVDSPKSAFTYVNFCPPSTQVGFVDVSLGDNSLLWMFGDGDTSSVRDPIHTYASTAPQTVYLATYNSASGCRDTSRQNILFPVKVYPTFSTADSNACRGDTIIFNTPTIDNNYYWFVNDTFKSPQAGFSYIFNDTGVFNISLVVADPNGCKDTITRIDYMHIGKPYIRDTLTPASGCWPLPVTFTDRSKDVQRSAFEAYKWTFGDGDSTTVGTSPIIHTYSAVGVYTVTETLTDNLGCTSKDTMTTPVTVYPHPVASFHANTKTPCPGAMDLFVNSSTGASGSPTWIFGDGSTSASTGPSHAYADTGHYTVMLVESNSFGCTDTADSVKYIYVSPSPVAAFSMNDSFSICPTQSVHFANLSTGASTYSWNFGVPFGTSRLDTPTYLYTTPGYDTVTLVATNAYGCSDTATRHMRMFGYNGDFNYSIDTGCVPITIRFFAVDIDSVPSIRWDFSDGTTDSVGFTDTVTHTYFTPGNYIPKLLLAGYGCPTNTSFGVDTIKLGAVPVVPGITGRDSVCKDATDTVYDNSTGGVWTSAPDSIASVDPSGVVFGVAAGNAVVTYSVTNHCGTKDTFKMVSVKPLPNPGVITGDSGVCLGAAIILEDTAAGGTWFESNARAASVSGGSVAGLSPGRDTIFYRVMNSCASDTVSHVVMVNPLPSAGTISGINNLCLGGVFLFTDTVRGGRWTGNVAITEVDTSTGMITGVETGISLITYTTKPDSNGCINFTTRAVTIVPPFKLSEKVAQISCYGANNGSVEVTAADTVGQITYKWTNGDSLASIDSLSPNIYTVVAQDDSSLCMVTDSIVISQPDSLLLTGIAEKDTCKEGVGSAIVTVTGGTYPYAYSWSNNVTDSVNGKLPEGPYSIMVTDLNKCQKSIDIIVEDTCNDIVVHDVITPNGDGINDVWVIEGIENYPGNSVAVFDKWGNELFHKDDYKNDWYGRDDRGELLPDGTYFYLVKLNAAYAAGGKNTFTGAILIKR